MPRKNSNAREPINADANQRFVRELYREMYPKLADQTEKKLQAMLKQEA